MAEPPRLSAILLSWDKSVIYFVTICVKDRRKVLDDWPYYLDFINEATREAVSFPYSDRAPIQSIGVGGI
jgi:hypothetical protein